MGLAVISRVPYCSVNSFILENILVLARIDYLLATAVLNCHETGMDSLEEHKEMVHQEPVIAYRPNAFQQIMTQFHTFVIIAVRLS